MTTQAKPPEVAIIVGQILHYREAFHIGLRERLRDLGIEHTLVYGTPKGGDRQKNDWTTLDFAHLREPRVVPLGSKSVSWQPCYRLVGSADLVIAVQHSSRIVNYPLWLRHLAGRQRFALWGHGSNLKAANASRAGEAIKRFMSRHVHWWFAYNDASARIVEGLGFPASRITSVQNSIDTRELRRDLDQVTDDDVKAYRADLDLRGSNVCMYIGGMYDEKRLPYLLQACDLIRNRVPDFEMLFVGGGPDQETVEKATVERTWMRYLGPRFGRDKALAMRTSKLLLMPGLVGLAVLDAFVADTPLVTVADSEHSPEIEYLQDGQNGRMVAAGATAREYADTVASLLTDEPLRTRLVEGGRVSAKRYTIEEMVDRYADGIDRALRT